MEEGPRIRDICTQGWSDLNALTAQHLQEGLGVSEWRTQLQQSVTCSGTEQLVLEACKRGCHRLSAANPPSKVVPGLDQAVDVLYCSRSAEIGTTRSRPRGGCASGH